MSIRAPVPPSCVWKVENIVILGSNHGFLTDLILDILFSFSEPHFSHASNGLIVILISNTFVLGTGGCTVFDVGGAGKTGTVTCTPASLPVAKASCLGSFLLTLLLSSLV